MPNVMEMMRSELMPMSSAVSVSKEAARIALPVFVFWTMYVRMTMSTAVMPRISICWPLITMPPTVPTVTATSPNIAGNVRGVGETKYIVVYSRKNETPMAVMSTEMRGAWRSGL